MKHGKKEKKEIKSLCVSSNVSYWSQIFGLPDLKQGARVAEHKSAPVPRQQREEKKKPKSRSSPPPKKKSVKKKKKERPSDPTTKSHGFLPLQLSITGEVVNVVNE